jgi:hypothetical protein
MARRRALTPKNGRPSPHRAQRRRADARGARTGHRGHYHFTGERPHRRPDTGHSRRVLPAVAPDSPRNAFHGTVYRASVLKTCPSRGRVGGGSPFRARQSHTLRKQGCEIGEHCTTTHHQPKVKIKSAGGNPEPPPAPENTAPFPGFPPHPSSCLHQKNKIKIKSKSQNHSVVTEGGKVQVQPASSALACFTARRYAPRPGTTRPAPAR